jgi:hypothetical protein
MHRTLRKIHENQTSWIAHIHKCATHPVWGITIEAASFGPLFFVEPGVVY